jgi:hypothetical protein
MKWMAIPCMVLLLAASQPGACEYHGQVVDADTSQPLAGAVVFVWWEKRPIISMDGPAYFHDAHETVTDADGRFRVSCWRKPDWNPFTYVRRPFLVVFKPGYEPVSISHSSNRGLKDYDAWPTELRDGATLRLPRLPYERAAPSGQYARGLVTGLGDLDIYEVPSQTARALREAINVQRMRAGLKPLTAPAGGV